MRIAVLFDRFGPYHVARLEAATEYCTVIPMELFGKSAEYKWDAVKALPNRITLFRERSGNSIHPDELNKAVHSALQTQKPDAVAINGWSDRGALSALQWCLASGVPAILMSESSAMDEERVWWKEKIKRRLIGLYSSGLVGGTLHREYLLELGMPAGHIFTGYDIIDNDYFSNAAAKARKNEAAIRQQYRLPGNYFLASNRFIKKKNLPFLLTEYSTYRRDAGSAPYDLVLLGDGELKPVLEAQISELGLQDHVHMPGFVQYNELPSYYAFAGAFVHASTSEQWGLVVNEAMASGLPVVVSDRCGCAKDLVKNGLNGYVFDPFRENELAGYLVKITADADKLQLMGERSREVITGWQPAQFGKGLYKAAMKAAAVPAKKQTIAGRLVLKTLINR